MSFQEPEDNIFDELIPGRRRLQRSLETASTLNPDTVASDRREAARRGMPVDTYATARQQNVPLPPANWQDLPDQFPEITAFLSRPENAAVAHDDLPALTGIERTLTFTGDLGRRLAGSGGMLGSAIAGISRGGQRLADRLGYADDSTTQRLFEGGVDLGARIEIGARNIAGTLNPRERALYGAQNNLLPQARDTGFTGDVVDALGQIATQIGVNIVTGGTGSAITMTGQGVRGMDVRVEEAMARDGRTDYTVADDIALGGGGALTLITEKLGLDAVLGRLPPALRAQVQGRLANILVGGIGEGTTEVADTVGQNLLAAALLGEDVSPGQGAAEAGAVGGTAGAIAALTVDLLTPGRRRSQARMEADAASAEQAAQTFQDLTDLSAASRLRERDPQTFQQFVEQMTENGPAENIYVDAQTFAQSLNDAGVSIEEVTAAIPSLADQLPNAIATGGDVRITTGEFAAHLATTDATAALLPHMRISPSAMSQAQAKEFMATRGEALQAEVEAAVAQATATEELRAGRERLQTRITEELNAAGRFTKDVNAAYATLPATFYDVMAARTGKTAEQLAEKYQLRYAAELPTSTGRRVMEQEDTVDLIHYSSTSGLMMSDPSRWGATGVTQDAERERRAAGAPGRTYFGVRGVYNGEPGTGIRNRSFRYQARVPASKLYDFDADPQNLKPTEGTPNEIATAYEKAIQAAGFSGYRSDAVIPGAVALFDAVDMEPEGPVRTAQDAQRLAARMRELAQQDRLARLAARTDPNESIATRPAEDFREQAAAELFGSSFAQSASLRDGRETLQKYGLNPNKRYSTRQVAAALEARQRAKYGSISAKDRSPEAAKKIAKWMAEEVQFELQNPEQSGVGWYSTKFQAALDIFAQEFPELATDKDARDTFTALIAITSDGQKVVPNFQQAAGIYRAFKTDGRFVADRGTQRQASVDQNLAKVQELHDTLGPAGMRETLLQELTVSDLKKKAAALGVEFSTSYKADVKLPLAAVIFGPKLGAFYANLMGADGYLTMDRWWSRTFNRYRGTLLQKPTAQGMARFRELLGQPNLSDDETLAAAVGPRNAYAARGYKNPSEIEAAANTLYKAAFENIEDKPFNASDRSFMLDTVAQARATLKRQGVEISVADIQAVLWYYEKRLYGELGARQTADVSYEEAAQRVVAEGTADVGALGPDLGGDWEAAAEQSDPGALAYNQGPVARSVDAYFSLENIGSLLEKDDWTILTAENPMGQQATPEENAKAQAKLVADLDALGVDYQPSIGRYGQIENSFVVVGITEKQARDLGAKYDQDSVLTRKGLIYQDGRVDAAVGLTVHDTRPEDYFTEVPGTGALFTVDLDFGEQTETFNQSDPFYSALERAVAGSPLTKAPAAQWMATLSKTPGVKKEEIEITGLNDWLDALADPDPLAQTFALEAGQVDAKGNVSKETVLAFVQSGGVRLEETVLGEPDPDADAEIDRLVEKSQQRVREEAMANPAYGATESRDGSGWTIYNRANYIEWSERFQTEAEAEAFAERANRLQLEERLAENEGYARRTYVEDARNRNPLGTRFTDYTIKGAVPGSQREFLVRLPVFKGNTFDSSEHHFEGINDIIGHFRASEHAAANGKKTMVLDEVQSTHHAMGEADGYAISADPATLAALQEAYNAALEAQRASWPPTVDAALRALGQHLERYRGNPGVEEATQRTLDDLNDRNNRNPSSAAIYAYNVLNAHSSLLDDEARVAMNAYSNARLRTTEAAGALLAAQGQGVADAPWKKSWDALLMKRAIRYAVDNGFEQIAWINGNQQNGGLTGGDGSWFYERNLVNVTNDIVKKFGTKVGKVDMIRNEPGSPRRDLMEFVAEVDARGENSGYGTLAEFQRPANKLGIQNGFEITPQLAEAARKGFALFQPNRGQIAFGQDITQTPSVISLLRAADLSTFIHETGHFFLEATADMANATDAPADIVADMATVLNWMRPGMTLADWNVMSLEERRPFHEKWARGFEAYHFGGRSPSLALRDVFRRFSAWLKNVYKSLTALDVELTDEVRQVMDRMLATEAEITEMEQARGLTPAFTNKPEFASDDEWEEYQRLAGDATAEAIEQLEQRSARDMRWASGAKDRYLRSLQREGEEQRKAVRAEVTAEVMAEPVNRARAFLRRGLGENGEPVEGAAKLDLATLKSLYGDEGTWTGLRRGGKYGEVSTDGLHPDAVASMFGYTNGQALIEDMVNGEDSADKIKGLTDQRMLERYGDLSDAQSIERAANEAVANEARAKFVAAEMAMADKAIGKKSILNSAAKEFAASVVNRLELKRLRPAQYLAAQGRAAKAAEKALKGDDLPGFATAKRNQLVNLHTGRAVQQAQKDVEKTMRLFTRIVSAKDDSISKSRNMDLVNAARAVLSSYGVGRVKNDPAGYMRALSQYDPTLYADIEPFVNGARGDAKPIVDLTYEQFTALRDTVNQLWALSRRTKQIEIDGKLMDREVVTTELGLRLDEIGIPAQAGVDRAPTDRDNRVRDLLGARAALRRVESWARGTDGANSGPFRKYIWNPISVAADAYRAESGVYIRRFRELLDGMRDELKPVDIKAPEIGYTFGGKSELFHALLHTGNGSNKSKLLLGRNWGKKNADGSLDDTRWQSFVDRLHTEGVLTQKDWTFVQAVWDLLEETKPGAQKAHRAIYGRYFDEVSADPVDTPFGQLRGGYVPAMTDGFLVQDAALRAEQEAIEGGDSAMFPAASNGFTKSRVEDYTRELALDLRLLPMHIDKVLKFTHLGPPVRDVARILKDRGFSQKLQAYDPTAQTDLLLPWLQRAAKQLVETPSKGRAGKAADRFFSAVRSRVGMQLMFANVVNTAQQVTGFSNVLLRVDAPILGDALWRYVRDPKGVAEAAASQSVFLANRMSSDIFEARQTIAQLTKLDPSKTDEAVAFLQRNAYFMQSALQNVMDVISWTAAFNQASGKGESDRDAARFADSVIRETQGTMAPEDVSRFETGPAFIRVFTQFAGYFNMMANLNATEVQLVARDAGLKKGMGRLFYVYLMGFAVPALLGDAIAKALRGGWEDEEGDGYLDDLFAWFFSSQAKFALAAVPVVGQAANAALGAFTKLPYDDRISMSPAVSVIESGLGTPAEVYQSLVDGESFNRADTRDALNLLGVLTGTPIGALAKPLGYGVGVAQGDIEPTGPLDAARGVITGAPSPESRMQ